MSTDPKLRGLGRGLSALLGEDAGTVVPASPRAPRSLPIEQLRPSRFQPRHGIDDEALSELAASIAAKGVLQPVLVRRSSEDPAVFEIIAGERRWRAAQLAQLHEIPVLVRDLTDQEAQEIALIENLQRQDLNALEEAEGYRRLIQEYAHTQEELARSVGKSRSHIANTMRLLTLPEPVRLLLEQGQLTAGHARAILGCAQPEAVALAAIRRGLNVRQTEALAAGEKSGEPARRRSASKDSDTLALERDLGALLGLPVEIRFRGNAGSLVLHYTALDQLDDILHRLSHGARGRRAAAPDA